MNKSYDLIIIGGGITGCSLLFQASQMGKRALLLEQHDYAAATSSNSLKTIHGGIRYLQNLDIKRMLQSSAECEWLLQAAPNLVKPLDCYMPVQAKISKSAFAYQLGALLFNGLRRMSEKDYGRRGAGLVGADDYQRVFTEQTAIKALYWQDAQVQDSERLAWLMVKNALDRGGEAKNYHRVCELIHQRDQTILVVSENSLGEREAFQAEVVVDCSGVPATGDSTETSTTAASGRVLAMNLVLQGTQADAALALPSCSADKASSMLFFSPWQGHTLVGTWYYPANEYQWRQPSDIPDGIIDACLSDSCRAYYGEAAESQFAEFRARLRAVHLGLLPASFKPEVGAERSLLKRDDIQTPMQTGHPGLYRVRGVKYTTARLLADQVLRKIYDTPPSEQGNQRSQVKLYQPCSSLLREQLQQYLGTDYGACLAERYGADSALLVTMLKDSPDSAEFLPFSQTLARVELQYAVRYEQVSCADDFLLRRTNIGLLTPFSDEERTHIDVVIQSWIQADRPAPESRKGTEYSL